MCLMGGIVLLTAIAAANLFQFCKANALETDAGVFAVMNRDETIEGIELDTQDAVNRTGSESLLILQILAGEDIANPETARDEAERTVFNFAKQMVNYQYLIGDQKTKEVVIVDGCWDPRGIKEITKRLGLNLTAYVATHYHWDHIGGEVPYEPFKSSGSRLPGLEYFALDGLPAYIPQLEAEKAKERCGLSEEDARLKILGYENKFSMKVGRIGLQFLHTPGHSPGSSIIVVSDADGQQRAVVTGDTLFPGSCGRIDLQDSDAMAMYYSLQNTVARLPDSLVVYPGHGYSGKSSTIGKEKQIGLLRQTSVEQWRQRMAR